MKSQVQGSPTIFSGCSVTFETIGLLHTGIQNKSVACESSELTEQNIFSHSLLEKL